MREKLTPKLRASSADRWLACRGSAVLEALNPWVRDEDSSPFAQEGTLAHSVAEYLLREKVGLPPIPRPSSQTTTPEMWAHGEDYAEYVYNLTESEHSEVFHFTEQRLKTPQAPHVSGISDYIGIDPDGRGYVVDYKYGAGVPVETEGNKQLLTYAVATLLMAEQLGIDLVTVTASIYQPRVFGGITSYTYTTDEVRKHYQALVTTDLIVSHPLEYSDKGLLHFEVTEKGCRWCPIKDYCPLTIDKERMRTIMKQIGSLQDFESLSIEELEEVYALAKEAKDIAFKAEKALRNRLLRGESGKQFKAVAGVKRLSQEEYSSWLETQVMLGNISEEDAFTKTPATQTDIKKRIDKDLARELNALPRTEGVPRIVDASHSAPAVGADNPKKFFTAI